MMMIELNCCYVKFFRIEWFDLIKLLIGKTA